MITSRSVLRRMRNVTYKSCRKLNTKFLFLITFSTIEPFMR
jgi:hypothetical protein